MIRLEFLKWNNLAHKKAAYSKEYVAFCVIRFQTALPRLLTFIRFVAVMRIFQPRYKGKYRHWHRHSEVCEHFAVIRKGERNNSVQQI